MSKPITQKSLKALSFNLIMLASFLNLLIKFLKVNLSFRTGLNGPDKMQILMRLATNDC
jgi:hypothetical protein